MPDTPLTYCFGLFRFDADSLELSREGRPVRLQPQPAQVLLRLVTNAGRLVSREDLRQAVWKHDTFVDFDRGLNFCIAQIRSTLGDDAAAPRYVRTVPKKGYEFICPVHAEHRSDKQPQVARADHEVHEKQKYRLPDFRGWLIVGAALLVFVSFIAYRALTSGRAVPIVAIVRFDNETGDPALAQFADNLTDTVTVQLTQASGGNFGVIGNAAILRGPREARDLRTIAASLNAGFIILGQVQRDQQRVRVLAHLIRMPEQTHLRVSRTENVDVGRVFSDPPATLATTDEIAGKIARAFGATLSDPARRDSRATAPR